MEWSKIKTGTVIIMNSQHNLPQKLNRVSNFVHTEKYVWKYPGEYDRDTARLILKLWVHDPELLKDGIITGPIIKEQIRTSDWTVPELSDKEVIRCSGKYLANRLSGRSDVVYAVTPVFDAYVWKYPQQFDRIQAKALLLIAVYQPEHLNGFFWGPHRIREHGVSRIMSMVMMGFAVLESDGHVRLSKTGEGFFRWSSRST